MQDLHDRKVLKTRKNWRKKAQNEAIRLLNKKKEASYWKKLERQQKTEKLGFAHVYVI